MPLRPEDLPPKIRAQLGVGKKAGAGRRTGKGGGSNSGGPVRCVPCGAEFERYGAELDRHFDTEHGGHGRVEAPASALIPEPGRGAHAETQGLER